MKTIGITGGIGSGKSFISRILTERYDIPVFNCDIEARRLTLFDPNIRTALRKLIGNDIYYEDGKLNKTLLADYMFVQGHVEEVNAIIHPAVRQWFEEWRKMMEDYEKHVAIESAILVECGFTDLCDEIWLVTAPLDLRIRRAMTRDNATCEQILARINKQTTDEQRRKVASHVIVNDGTGDLISQIKSCLGDDANAAFITRP